MSETAWVGPTPAGARPVRSPVVASNVSTTRSRTETTAIWRPRSSAVTPPGCSAVPIVATGSPSSSTVSLCANSSATKTRPAAAAASCGSRPVGALVSRPLGTSTLSSMSASSAGTSTRPPSNPRCRGGSGSGTRRTIAPVSPSTRTSSPGSRTPTANVRAIGSATTPSGLKPTCTIRPGGSAVAGGDEAGSAAGGSSSRAAEPQPAATRTASSGTTAARGTMPRAWHEEMTRRCRPPTTASPGPTTADDRVAARLLPAAGFAAMAVTVALGLWLARHDGRELGLPFPPFVGRWDPAATGWALAAAALLALAVWVGPRLLSGALEPAAFAAACTRSRSRCGWRSAPRATAPPAGRASSTPTGSRGRTSTCPRSQRSATAPASSSTASPSSCRRCPSTPPGHPPGLLLVMDAFAIDTPGRLAALCIAGGALVAPLAYALARHVLDERRARVAGAADGDRAVGAAVRRDVRRRALRALGARRRDSAGVGAAVRAARRRRCSRSRRCSPGRCWRSARGPRCWRGAATASRTRCALALALRPPCCSRSTARSPR